MNRKIQNKVLKAKNLLVQKKKTKICIIIVIEIAKKTNKKTKDKKTNRLLIKKIKAQVRRNQKSLEILKAKNQNKNELEVEDVKKTI